MKTWGFAAALGLALVPLAGAAQGAAAAPSFLHVQVSDGGAKESKVSVNLPLALLDVAFDVVQDEHLKGGRLKLEQSDLDVADLRRVWAELKKAGDAEFVTVEEKDQSVRVERKGQRVLVRVSDKPGGTDKVRVDVPMSVVDALFSGEGDSLNLKDALAELKRTAAGEFIRVDDGNSRVRVWID